MKKILAFFPILLLLVSCNSESLSTTKATSLIQEFSSQYPIYESANLALGNQKINTSKDRELVHTLKNLEQQELISLQTKQMKKKLLSKDSIWEVNVSLSSKASAYVVQQKKNKAEVKTYLFSLQKDRDISLKLNGKTKATATAKLIKEPTPFAGIRKDQNPNSDFITRDFILKYKKESGWYVVK